MIRKLVFSSLALAALFAICSPAQAQWGSIYGGGVYGGWNSLYPPEQSYYAANGRVPPYFSIYPPVYYSGQIVRIPYGASPWAYPIGRPWGPDCMNAQAAPQALVPAATGTTITNPHFLGDRALTRAPEVKSEQGVMIDNPFYRRDEQLTSRE